MVMPLRVHEVRNAFVDGIMDGVREGATNLLKVANSGSVSDDSTARRDRARLGLIKLKVHADMMLALVEEVFGDDEA